MNKNPFQTKFHKDGSVTIWDVYQQQWVRTSNPTNEQLATLSNRDRILKHVRAKLMKRVDGLRENVWDQIQSEECANIVRRTMGLKDVDAGEAKQS